MERYEEMLTAGQLPLGRAMAITPTESLIREMILQLKVGKIDAGYFRRKFGREILQDFSAAFDEFQERQMLTVEGDAIKLTKAGLLRVDSLLPAFFLPEHRGDRYA